MGDIRTQWLAFLWLQTIRGLPSDRLYCGNNPDDPDIIYVGESGHFGYEIKTLRGKTIIFEKQRYNSIRDNRHGEVLVFRANKDNPYKIIPFNSLPENGGACMGIMIHLREVGGGRATIAFNTGEKIELEKIRAEIETNTLPQGDWADMLLQAMYVMLCDVGLIRYSYANRLGIKHFTVPCPYCNTDSVIEGRYRLYWMLECSYCKRKFVAKRKV